MAFQNFGEIDPRGGQNQDSADGVGLPKRAAPASRLPVYHAAAASPPPRPPPPMYQTHGAQSYGTQVYGMQPSWSMVVPTGEVNGSGFMQSRFSVEHDTSTGFNGSVFPQMPFSQALNFNPRAISGGGLGRGMGDATTDQPDIALANSNSNSNNNNNNNNNNNAGVVMYGMDGVSEGNCLQPEGELAALVSPQMLEHVIPPLPVSQALNYNPYVISDGGLDQEIGHATTYQPDVTLAHGNSGVVMYRISGVPQESNLQPQADEELVATPASPQMLEHVRAPGPWLCGWGSCDSRGPFTQKSSLWRHIQIKHIPHDWYFCVLCGGRFKRRDKAMEHIRAGHELNHGA